MKKALRFYSALFSSAHVIAPAVFAILVAGPLFHNDFALLIYQQRRAVEFFASFRNLWGYDPYFSAGYPLNFTWNSNVFLQFLSVVFHPAPEYVVLLISSFASIAIAPFCFWAGLRNFGVMGQKRDAAISLMIACWWCGFMAVLMQIGMPTALFIFHISFYAVSVFYKWLSEPGDGALPLLYALGPLCLLIHKTAVVTVALPVAMLLICNLRAVTPRRAAHLVGIAALSLAVNSFWLVPFIHLVKYKVTLPEAPHGLCLDPLRIFKDYFTFSKIMGHKVIEAKGGATPMLIVSTVLRDMIMVFGIAGVLDMLKKPALRKQGIFFGMFIAVFLAIVYFGSLWPPLALLNPTRYVGYMDMFIAMPAVYGLAALNRKLSAGKNILASAAPAATSVFFAAAFLLSSLFFILFLKEMGSRLDADTKALVKYIAAETTPMGRVMLEDSGWNDRESLRNGTPPRYSGSHFPSLMSELTGREFIGGPYPYVFLAHHYADFHDGDFLRKPIKSYDINSLETAMDAFYIRWIVCWSAECNDVMKSSREHYRLMKNIGKFNVYSRLKFNSSPMIEGDGYVRADIRGIKVFRAEPEGGSVVLKYHWFEGLETRGAGVLRHENKYGPVGFIEIKNPPEYFFIRNSYEFDQKRKQED